MRARYGRDVGEIWARYGRDGLHLEELHRVVHEALAALLGQRGRQPQRRRELERLEHGRHLRVHPELLHVPHLLDEGRVVLWLAVDVDTSGDRALGLAAREHVEQRGLARAR